MKETSSFVGKNWILLLLYSLTAPVLSNHMFSSCIFSIFEYDILFYLLVQHSISFRIRPADSYCSNRAVLPSRHAV